MILFVAKVLLIGSAVLTLNRLIRREDAMATWLEQIEVGALIGSLFLFSLYNFLTGSLIWLAALLFSVGALIFFLSAELFQKNGY